jgi:hypothetical protein
MTIVLALAAGAGALEDTLSLGRCEIINHPTDASQPSLLFVTFQFPESMIGKEVMRAELSTRFSLGRERLASPLELRFSPLLIPAPENNPNYEELGTLLDSMGAGSWLCPPDSVPSFRVDITEFARQVVQGERANLGLVGSFSMMGHENIRIAEELSEMIRGNARVRVVYK